MGDFISFKRSSERRQGRDSGFKLTYSARAGGVASTGLSWRTMGADAMCKGVIDPLLPKTQYKFTLLHPVPETHSAHVIGESALNWGIAKTIPAVGQDPIYTIWRWNDCCNN